MKKLFGLLFILIGVVIIWKMFIPTSWGSGMINGGEKSGSISVSGVQTIAVQGKAANVHILAAGQNKLTAKMKGNGSVSLSKSGNKMKVEVHNRWVDWVPIGKQTVLYVYVPESYSQSVHLDITAGNINVNGSAGGHPMALKEFSVKMSAGNMTLKNFSMQKFQDHGSAGDVNVDRVNTQLADFHLSAGNVNLSHFSGKLKANLSAGQLTAQLDQLSAPADVKVSAGNVSLDLPKEASAAVDAQVSTGNVNCNLPLQKTSINEKRHIKGVHGSGSYPVDVNVSIGDIHIN